jgi:predicted phosphodiesterase
MEMLPNEFYTILGNHDLPQHNLELSYKCGVNTLREAGRLDIINGIYWGVNTLREAGRLAIINGIHWGEDPETSPQHLMSVIGRKMVMWHVMNYQGKKPWPGCTDPSSASLIRKHPGYDLILTGHNHKPFVEEHEGRLLVNPGCITRQSASELHAPRVYLWYAATNIVKPVYLPIEEDVITREHLDEVKARDERIDAFISSLDDNWEAQVSFADNLQIFRQANNIRKSVFEIIYKAIGS